MSPVAPGFPALKAKKLLRLLQSLGYVVVRRRGSHRTLRAPDRPQILFSFHDGDEIGPAMVRTILVRNVGLSVSEAKEVVRRG